MQSSNPSEKVVPKAGLMKLVPERQDGVGSVLDVFAAFGAFGSVA